MGLDLYRDDVGFAEHTVRRERIEAVGLVAPPVLFEGVLGSREALVELMSTSRFGHEPMEGVVVRRGRDERARAVRPGFVRAGDDVIARTRNVVLG